MTENADPNALLQGGDHLTLNQVYDKFGQHATFQEAFYDWFGLNKSLFLGINHIRAGGYDRLMQMVTELGDREHFALVVALAAGYAALAWLVLVIRKQAATRQFAMRWMIGILVLCAAFAVNGVIIHFMKDFFAMPRPYAALVGENVFQLEARPATEALRSFPSGHMAFITLVVASLWPLLSNPFRWVAGFVAFAVGWSRISLGVHFPADVAWSFIFALLITIAVRWAIQLFLRTALRAPC